MFYHQGSGYAIIEDFNRREGDKIQVFGSTENVSFSPGTMDGRDVTRIYYGSDEDLVAIVLDSPDIGMYDLHYLSPISRNPVFDNVLPPTIFTPSLSNQFFPTFSF